MSLVRLARPDDLDDLLALARTASAGLTTLPDDGDALAARLDASARGAMPLLVMERPPDLDPELPGVVGTAGLCTRVGDARRAEPFYAYRLEKRVHRSDALGVDHEVQALHLVEAFDGPTEVGTLFLHPAVRGGGRGRVLSLARFVWMAREPARFSPQVIAELRGVVDDDGRSPFWDGLGRHFFRVDFPTADLMSARDKRFIAELMPRHPVYVPLLPAAARAVIGRVHPETRPAKRLLEAEGFHAAGMVDIFDAGPCLRCDRAAIRIVRNTREAMLEIIDEAPAASPPNAIVGTTEGAFRAIGSRVEAGDGRLRVPRAEAARLGVEPGQTVCWADLPAKTPAVDLGRAVVTTPQPETMT